MQMYGGPQRQLQMCVLVIQICLCQQELLQICVYYN